MDIATLSEGSLFATRYRIVRRIGQGGMGAVYEVVHLETTRHRALKVMLPSLVESDELRERFQREARVAAQIDSAHIVDVFDAGIDEATNMPFLVMALLRGEELGKRLKRVGRFGYEEAVGYLWHVALALDKTHRAHIVHRDLKPENLFLSEEHDEPPRVKVLDFGVAKFIAEHGTAVHATRSIGTPLYMAPEQFQTGSKVRPATDIYALGMIAYSFLVGKPYWFEEQQAGGGVFAFMRAVMFGPTEPATLRAQRREVSLPRAFDAWFQQITAKEPNDRYFSATEAIAALARVLEVSKGDKLRQGASLRDSMGETDSYATTAVKLARKTNGLLMESPMTIERATVSIHDPAPSIQPPEQATGFGLSTSQPKEVQSPDQLPPAMGTIGVEGLTTRRRLSPARVGGIVLFGLGICTMTLIARNNGSTQEDTELKKAPGARMTPDPSVPISATLPVRNDPPVLEKPSDPPQPPPTTSSAPAVSSTVTTPTRQIAPPPETEPGRGAGRVPPVRIEIVIGMENRDPVRD